MGKKKEVKGAAPAAGGANHEVAIMKAIKNGQPRDFEALLDKPEVDVNSRVKNGDTLLTACINACESVMVDMLLERGADPNLPSAKGRKETPLTAACWALDDMCVIELLKAGADPTKSNEDGRTPLHIAAINGAPEIFMLILTGVTDPELYDNPAKLMEAMEKIKDEESAAAAEDDEEGKKAKKRQLHPDMMQLLDVQCNEGATALHFLFGELTGGQKYWLLAGQLLSLFHYLKKEVKGRQAEIYTHLQRKTKEGGHTVLHYLTMSCINLAAGESFLKDLIQLGADPYLPDNEGMTPLMIAAGQLEHLKMVKVLVDAHIVRFGVGKPIPPNKLTGCTVMHMAAASNAVGLMEFFMKYSKDLVDMHAEDKEGVTPLVAALENGADDAVAYLVKNGAPQSVVDSFNAAQAEAAKAAKEGGCCAHDDEECEEEEDGDYSGHGNTEEDEEKPKQPPKRPTKKSLAAAKEAAASKQKVEEESQGPSTAAYIVFFLMVSSMLLPFLDKWTGSNYKKK